MQRRSLILLGFVLLAAGPAYGEFRGAEAAFRAGHYEAAFDKAGAEHSADAHAFRARSLLALAMSGDADPPRSLLDAALSEAETALALEPLHFEGRLQKAIALSLILRPMSLGEANRTGYGGQSRSLAEEVLKDDPENYYAHGFLAVWHVEVVRRGGLAGSAIMGASVRAGRSHYEEAIRLAPDDAGLHWQWARALAALDARKYRRDIETALVAAKAVDPQTELDRVMRGRAEQLLTALGQYAVRDVERQARQML